MLRWARIQGYHKEAEFIVATWPKETEALWELIWEKNCQTVVVLGGHSEFWQNIETAGELTIQRNGDDTTIISSNEDQASIPFTVLNSTYQNIC